MNGTDMYCVEHLLKHCGDTPSTWSKDRTYEEATRYDGNKTIVLIDADMWRDGKTKEAVLKTFNKGDHCGHEWRELSLYDYKIEGDNAKVWVHTRRCSECGALMFDGFMVDGGWEYYCSEECLHKHYTEEEWEEMYGDGDTDSCWTAWY